MKIVWTEPAISDLENIKKYIERDSEYYAVRFIGRIIEAIEKLLIFPEMGRWVPEAEDKRVRELLVDNYRIMYRIETNRILILTFIHGARDIRSEKSKPCNE